MLVPYTSYLVSLHLVSPIPIPYSLFPYLIRFVFICLERLLKRWSCLVCLAYVLHVRHVQHDIGKFNMSDVSDTIKDVRAMCPSPDRSPFGGERLILHRFVAERLVVVFLI